ncbi:hypothetical protein FB567DRAFT_329409 [Paraphoma chrysanthemicola]|uniref:Uncharacterized protein n=1 Tax=Paraphoma chrysanthemicola TaxID=798071 RepID=A0A8K0R8H1_9PLEO|nr:hypothetical protein FB567DRAFT_329409 [Paraphoma chrysanthemicola]
MALLAHPTRPCFMAYRINVFFSHPQLFLDAMLSWSYHFNFYEHNSSLLLSRHKPPSLYPQSTHLTAPVGDAAPRTWPHPRPQFVCTFHLEMRGSCATPTRDTTCPQRSSFTILYRAVRHLQNSGIQGRISPLGKHVSPARTLLTQSEFNVHARPFQESRRGGKATISRGRWNRPDTAQARGCQIPSNSYYRTRDRKSELGSVKPDFAPSRPLQELEMGDRFRSRWIRGS